MKNSLAFFMVIALLVMNFTSIAHVECTKIGGGDGATIAESIDYSNDQDGNTQKSACDYCATCGLHHHTHAALSQVEMVHFPVISDTPVGWGGASYLSQLHYPPSKPPKS